MRDRSTLSNSLTPAQAAPSLRIINIPLVVIALISNVLLTSALSIYLIAQITSTLSISSALIMTGNTLRNVAFTQINTPNWYQWFEVLFSSERYGDQIVVSIFLTLILLSTILVARVLLSKFKSDGLVHIKGPKLLEGKRAIKRLKKVFKPEYRFAGKGLYIHPQVHIPSQRENQNILVVGSVGSGKTQFILPIVQQIVLKQNAKSVIFDYKGDFTEYFYEHDSVKLFAPWDERSLCWDIREDLQTTNDALLFAEAIIPAPKGGMEPMWILGSRSILTGSVIAARKKKPETWGWDTLSKILSMDIQSLHRLLSVHYPAAATLLDKNSKTSASFYQTLQSYCQPIHSLAELKQNRSNLFSIKKWLRDQEPDGQHLILQSNPEFATLSKTLAELFLYFSSRYLLALPDDMNRQVYFILDEAAHLQFKQLPELVSTGRSKGARVLIGVQDLGLFSEQFSDAQIDALASMIGTMVSFRLSSLSKFTQKVSDGFGKRVVERLNTNRSNGDNRRSSSWQYQELPLVSATDLMELTQAGKNGVTGYIKFAGTNTVAKLRWPLTKLAKVALPVIPIKSDTAKGNTRGVSRHDELLRGLNEVQKLASRETPDA